MKLHTSIYNKLRDNLDIIVRAWLLKSGDHLAIVFGLILTLAV